MDLFQYFNNMVGLKTTKFQYFNNMVGPKTTKNVLHVELY